MYALRIRRTFKQKKGLFIALRRKNYVYLQKIKEMRRLFLLTFIALMLTPFAANANGGPVIVLSAMRLSRTPVMRHCPEVRLIREEARFTPDGRYTRVEVKYLLQNTTEKTLENLWYGFPIDWYGSQDSVGLATVQPFTDSYGQEVGWRERYIQDVFFSLDGEELITFFSADTVLRYGHPLPQSLHEEGEPQALWDSVGDAGGFFTVECDLNRRWYYTSLYIKAGEVVELVVSYRIHNAVGVWGEAMEIFESTQDYATFEYDFSPASYWGNGHVDELFIEVDTIGMRNKAEYLGFGKGFPMENTSDSRWTLTLKDVDLAKAEPFKMGYQYYDNAKRTVNQLLAMRISPSHYEIIPSGVDKKYPIGNLSDFDLKTATVLRPDKEGKYRLTLHMIDSIEVTGIIIVPGYGKDSTSWYNNSRICSIKAAAFNSYWNSVRKISTPKSFDWQGLIDASIKYSLRYEDYYYNEETHWSPDVYRGAPYIKDVHFEVTDIIKGNKYDDLCISEIIVLGTPKKRY